MTNLLRNIALYFGIIFLCLNISFADTKTNENQVDEYQDNEDLQDKKPVKNPADEFIKKLETEDNPNDKKLPENQEDGDLNDEYDEIKDLKLTDSDIIVPNKANDNTPIDEEPNDKETAPDDANKQSGGKVYASYKEIKLNILDKITSEIVKVSVFAGSKVDFKHLDISATKCQSRFDSDGDINYGAFLTVNDKSQSDVQIFKGWMLSFAKEENTIEHDRYFVWLDSCK